MDPEAALMKIGLAGAACVRLLEDQCDVYPIAWRGKGDKSYSVFTEPGVTARFSRAVRNELFVLDADDFQARWQRMTEGLAAAAGAQVLQSVDPEEIDRLFYTAVVGFAAALEVGGSGDRGGPGTFFEMAVGPAVSLLTGLLEESAITLPLGPGASETETVTTDLSFVAASGSPVLVLPTKISTRERVSQPYVHQAILERADPSRTFRSALCVGAETNMLLERGSPRSVGTASVTDTLVPKTIVLYQRYIAQLSAMYYLDPPHEYTTTPLVGFPQVKQFSALLTRDLPTLLA